MTWGLILALVHAPLAVEDLTGIRNPNGTVRLTWRLPDDVSVVGVTVIRQRLAGWDEDLFELGRVDIFLDPTAHGDRSYGYWVFTRDAGGDLSEGVYVEVWSETDHEDLDAWCFSSTGSRGGGPMGPAVLALLGLAAGRGRSGRSRNRGEPLRC